MPVTTWWNIPQFHCDSLKIFGRKSTENPKTFTKSGKTFTELVSLELRKGCLFSTVYLWAGPFHGLQGGTLGVQKSEAKCAKLVDLGKCYQYRSPFVFSISLFDRYHMPRRYRGRPARSHLSSPIRRALRLRNDAQRPGHRDPPRAWRLCLCIELN